MPDLDALLAPRSIAIIGASPDTTIIRGKIQHVLQARGFPGPVHPISRSHAEIQGRRAYRSIAEVPERVDLAVVVIPAAAVPEALEECGRAGVKAAYIISSGFAEEASESGPALQRAVREIAARYDMAVCGPNAEGFFNAPAQVVATFSPAVEDYAQPLLPDVTRGRRIAVAAQSGGIGFAFFHRGRPRQLRFEVLASTGNEAALEGFDLVEHLIDADRADIFLLYLEAVRNPQTFLRAATKAAERGKPLIVAKMGRSEVARRAAASHTGALAGSDAAYEAVFRRHGVIRGEDMDQMLDIAAGFAFCPLPRGRRVAVMSGSGGAAVWMAETLVAHGLEVPPLDEATRREIAALMPSYGTAANPVDLTAGAIGKVGYAHVVGILQRSPVVDAVVIVGSVANAHRLREDQEKLAQVASHPEKPVLFCAYTRAVQEAVDLAAACGVPIFTSMPNCARAIRAMADYRRFREGLGARLPEPTPPPAAGVGERLRGAGRILCEHEAKELLEAYGVPRPPESLAAGPEEAAAVAARLGFPVALKIQSPEIPHKTEIGGVALNLASAEAVRAACRDMLERARAARPDATIRGVLVQRMAPPGQEIILGVSRDRDFGPMLMVGLGGIHVEVLRDVAFAPAPLGAEEARALLAGLKGAALLKGVRGAPPADVEALVGLMVRLGRFAGDFAEDIEEIDLNPVIVHPAGEGLTVVDALVVRREERNRAKQSREETEQ
ncbi:acetate--CoA ligase family protein [Crenalkalicoccus roseus]|uniref:acetate--CoA ligase family protein n=1 Tax=Crenalkalicoccus roseus TaxID=1485588 RepID=UPI00108057BE|nr:acetate--CoA ligase family protein [Crenalkalicoccus roseus]